MTTRRTLFQYLAGLIPALGIAKAAKPPLAAGHEIIQSFDARVWAHHFVEHVRQLPGLPLDEETMATWFANALMRGYDERARRNDSWEGSMIKAWRENDKLRNENADLKYKMRLFGPNVSEEEIRAAVAQGWCADVNRFKPMDCDLAQAIVDNVHRLARV